MLTTCPNCGTNFSVPDTALGREGRKLKCAKCGETWFQTPLRLEEEEEEPPFLPAAAVLEPEPEPEPDFGFAPFNPVASKAEPEPAPSPPDFDFSLKPPSTADRAPPVFEEPPEGLLEAGSQPVPEFFAQAAEEPRHRGGVAALWGVLGLLVLGGLGGAAYYFQDPLVDLVPEAGPVLASVGLRHEVLGAGLELRKAGSPERFVRNDVEVLRVCGLIVNISDHQRPVPTMKLVLLDKAGQAVQEELARPPVSTLAPQPQAAAPFCILRERPDPNAVEVVVVFSDQAAPEAPVARPLDRLAPRPTPAEALPPAEAGEGEAALAPSRANPPPSAP